jgi:hypothetical protein
MPIHPRMKPEDRRKVAGVEIQEKLRKLQGRQESGLVADHVRGPGSPLGQRKVKEEERRKGR